jgi:hypothetical protein
VSYPQLSLLHNSAPVHSVHECAKTLLLWVLGRAAAPAARLLRHFMQHMWVSFGKMQHWITRLLAWFLFTMENQSSISLLSAWLTAESMCSCMHAGGSFATRSV